MCVRSEWRLKPRGICSSPWRSSWPARSAASSSRWASRRHAPSAAWGFRRWTNCHRATTRWRTKSSTARACPHEHRELPRSFFGSGAEAPCWCWRFWVWSVSSRPGSWCARRTIWSPWWLRSGSRSCGLALGRCGGLVHLIPLVWTRRTIARMRGVRIITRCSRPLTLLEVAHDAVPSASKRASATRRS